MESNSEHDTRQIAREFAREITVGDVICLEGELGSGKTLFTTELVHALGINDYVSSPTFSLLNIYNGSGINVYHFDLYRVSNVIELDYTNYEDYLYNGDGVCIVEWASNLANIIPKDAYWLTFTRDLSKHDCFRLITKEVR